MTELNKKRVMLPESAEPVEVSGEITVHRCHTIDYKGCHAMVGQCLDPSVPCEGG